ncbi:hypothetical protein CH63R_02095 [Colletotrichum higginsianum IMI 349063]|uniref:Luciferase domain-containing protein n=2 Tax=Colletotrichum higginsianum TaxID=80884 RepID=A0A1B7YMY5_COLHI|nr:hypothetical protein CH63R_02095 [Colletotrichum higginsianum IMI 349063]OBR13369.1 hypothetical protein CH63R_02095 [Colletotrichum higginsianum IMI 349063]TID02461.1 hypothetical protein CH35J_003604 [Colletotrichum higginsianum]GJC95959.1 hypothetical protein ColKHC_04785 [Colletotrichum higginsianum]
MTSPSQTLSLAVQPLLRRPVLTALLTSLSASVFAWAVRDYRAYIALGPGGVPHNFAGWLLVTLAIRPFALSKTAATWTGDFPAEGAHEDVKQVPQRRGDRAELGGIVPHRQLSQHAPVRMREYIQNLFANAVTQNRTLLESKLSLYERNNPALFVSAPVLASSPAVPAASRTARGEIGHYHGDLSVHMYLSPADARLAVEKGWAERHRLALPRGSLLAGRFRVADSYLMIYGPRDEDEMEVLATFLRNGIRYMTGAEDIRPIVWNQLVDA